MTTFKNALRSHEGQQGRTLGPAGPSSPAPVLQDPLTPSSPAHRSERPGAVSVVTPQIRPDFDFAYFVLKIATAALWTVIGLVILKLWKLGII